MGGASGSGTVAAAGATVTDQAGAAGESGAAGADGASRCPPNYTGDNCDVPRFELVANDTFEAQGISSDGSVLVGYFESAETQLLSAAKYTAGKLTDLGAGFESQANAPSADGSVIVGVTVQQTGDGGFTNYRALAWSGTTTATFLPSGDGCYAADVSADGSVILGLCQGSLVLWVNGVFEDLGLAGTFSHPKLSLDGNWIVGAHADDAQSTPIGFVWSKSTGLKLMNVPASFNHCELMAITANGSLAVGACGDGNWAGVTWDSIHGTQVFAPPDRFHSVGVNSVSEDGSFIGGSFGADMVRWDKARAPHQLSSLVPAALTTGLGFQYRATFLSSDGLTIAGVVDTSPGEQSFIMRTGN